MDVVSCGNNGSGGSAEDPGKAGLRPEGTGGRERKNSGIIQRKKQKKTAEQKDPPEAGPPEDLFMYRIVRSVLPARRAAPYQVVAMSSW
jgi:hypothetical protein